MKLVRDPESTLTAIKPEHPVFMNIDKISWTPWVIEGTHFKLLHVHKETGGFTMMLKVDPGNESPVHGHIGAVEVYIIEGEFGYEEDRGDAGSYGYEPLGARHEPTSPGGCIMFAVAHGPLVGYGPDGEVSGVIDGQVMFEMAEATNAHTHLVA